MLPDTLTTTAPSIPRTHPGLPAEPHGGVLRPLLVDPADADELRRLSRTWPSRDLTPRQLCDAELLLNGGFSPLPGFMCRSDYESVCRTMRLGNGTLWPIPVTLDVSEEVARTLAVGSLLALRDAEGVLIAAMDVEEVWQPDRLEEARLVFGTTRRDHPGVRALLDGGSWYVGGAIRGIQLPTHYDNRDLRLSPAELRRRFDEDGWSDIVAFQTRNPMHRAHQELTLRAAEETGARVLIHPVVGLTKPGDVDHYTRVRCYRSILDTYPDGMARLALLPLAMRMAGPREAVWHAIIRKNYGCTHLIVGRDHAGPGSAPDGTPYYGPYDAQELVREHERELGVRMVPFRNMVYLPDRNRYVPEDEVTNGDRVLSLSGTHLRSLLARGSEIPAWFTFPQVARQLQLTHPPRHRQGFTVFFTGLSGSGKSTIANVLRIKLLEHGGRTVTLLDGDLVRKNLSSELGFSREHRDLNIRRIGYVAATITMHGGVAICAPIAPYDTIRREVRGLVEANGGFVLVHVATPLEVCEARDRKGLYAKARAGLLPQFTGISDPYEPPADAELVIDTGKLSPEESADAVLAYLEHEGYLRAE